MKKVLRYLLMTVMALFVSLPCLSAEAASVALLPLINNVEGGDDVANQVFYKEALTTLKLQKGFVLMEMTKSMLLLKLLVLAMMFLIKQPWLKSLKMVA